MTAGVDHLAASTGGRAALRRGSERADVVRAIIGGELHVVFQPIVALPTGQPVGAEALLRWGHGDDAVPPPAFWHLVDAPLAREIGRFVLESACTELVEWRRNGSCPEVSVNVDPRELAPGWVNATLATLARHDLPPSAVTLELTEAARPDDVDVAGYVAALGAAGVRVALDDTGTGYNALAAVRDFPLNELKIDRAFVAGIGEPRAETLIRALIRIAQELGLRTVAEGVETEHQAQWLSAQGVDRAQGYLFGTPMTAASLCSFWWSNDAGTIGHAFLRHLHESGSSPTTIAAILNNRGVLGPNGRRWHPRAVARALDLAAPETR